jgi:hypothetical protein
MEKHANPTEKSSVKAVVHHPQKASDCSEPFKWFAISRSSAMRFILNATYLASVIAVAAASLPAEGKISANKISANKITASKITASKTSGDALAAAEAVGNGAFLDVNAVELPNGVRIAR